MTVRSLTIAGVALWVGAAPVAAQRPGEPKPARADSVTLTFDWPVGLRASVSHRRGQIQARGGRADSSVIEVRYRMAVETHPRGRRVSYSDFALPPEFDSLSGRVGPDAWAAIAGVFAPPILIADSGDMLGLADPEGYVAAIRAVLAPHLDSLPADSTGDRARAFFERFLSPEVLTAQAASDWNLLVGFWIGARLERGVVLELTNEEPIPIFPGRTVPYHYLFGFEGREPCTEEARDSACVVLELITRPDSAAVRALVTSLVRDLVPGSAAAGFTYRRLEIENHIRLLTEPRGMIPHRLEIEQAASVEVEVPGEPVQAMSQIRARRLEFAYDRPRP